MQKFENIYMVCPPQTESGGPEASHQLVGEMCKLDISADLIYYKKKKTIFLKAPLAFTLALERSCFPIFCFTKMSGNDLPLNENQ